MKNFRSFSPEKLSQFFKQKERKKLNNFCLKNCESFSYENDKNFKNISLSNDSSTNGIKRIQRQKERERKKERKKETEQFSNEKRRKFFI